ncbi:MAG: hypothetical protein ABI342_07455 [Nitrososphaera sp.]|jgi:hypothetical protein
MATPHIIVGTADSKEYKQLVKCIGTGRLKGLGISNGPYRHYFKVELDSVSLCDDVLCSNRGGVANNGIAIDLPFSNEMIVSIRDSTKTPQPRFWVAFETTGDKPKLKDSIHNDLKTDSGERYQTIIHEYEQEAYPKSFTIEKLIENKKIAEIQLERDWFHKNESISGTVKINTSYEKDVIPEIVNVILVPSETITPIQITTAKLIENFIFHFDQIKESGFYEIIPKIDEYSNFSTRVKIL